jgi:hypothetical protein
MVDAEYSVVLWAVNLAGKRTQVGTFTLNEVGPEAAPSWLDAM